MSTLDPVAVLNRLNWRYATKKYDPSAKIPTDVWHALEQSLVLSPSSFGLQPWKFFVIDDPAVRVKMREAGWNQPQFVDASHLVVFASRTSFATADVERYVARMAEVTGAEPSRFDGAKRMMVQYVNAPPPHVKITEWAARQAYIALGVFLTTAAVLGVDATPMEGFDPVAVNKILNLTDQGYNATVMATAGYRAHDDKYAVGPKIRYLTEHVVEHV